MQDPDTPKPLPFAGIVRGTAFTGALALATLSCSGDSTGPAPEPLVFTQISVGAGHTCGLTAAGTAWCWGSSSNGKLGTGPDLTGDQIVPAPVAGGLSFSTISAGEEHTCAVAVGGVAYCWGQNSFGPAQDHPVAVAGDVRFLTIATGSGYACAISTTNDAYCWGSNDGSALGVGDEDPRSEPTPVVGGYKFTAIAVSGGGVASGRSSCALTADGKAYCWGSNTSGQLAADVTGWSAAPVASAANLTFASISVGGAYACGVTTTQDAYCWGQRIDGSGALTLVAGGYKWRSVRLSESAQCGVTIDAQAFCWGNNDFGKLGNGLSASQFYTDPTAVVGGLMFGTVAPGRSHSCGLTSAGAAYCWGIGVSGLLGIGAIPAFPDPYVSYAPVPVIGPATSGV